MRSITSRVLATLAALGFAMLAIFGPAPSALATDPPQRPVQALPATLRVGTEGVYPPFSYRDGNKLTGFDVDVMNAIGRKLGVKIQFVEVPWDSMFEALRSKRIDLVANQVTLNPERQQQYDLSTPYVDTTGVLVVNEKNTSITSLRTIRGKRAAQNLTSNWKDVAQKNGARIVGVDSMDKAIQNLRQGSVDVMINDKLAVNNALKQLGSKSGVKVVAETSDRSQSVLAARKGSGYMPQINQALNSLKSDGTVKQLYDQYF